MTPRRSATATAIAVFAALGVAAASPRAAAESVLVQSTTSTQNSGFYDAILPQFEDATGLDVRVVAVGTGQALENARRGDADVVIVHARSLEDAFMAEGFGSERRDLMWNAFVLVGPRSDPGGVRGRPTAAAALAAIAAAQAPFASRGDDSGTHARERALWRAAGVDLSAASGAWYLETGSGMGATLNVASARGAYALTDRATWAAFGNRGDLELLLADDPALVNPYGVILVDPARHPHVNAAGARRLLDWLTSEAGRAAIEGFEISGEQVFFPGAPPRPPSGEERIE